MEYRNIISPDNHILQILLTQLDKHSDTRTELQRNKSFRPDNYVLIKYTPCVLVSSIVNSNMPQISPVYTVPERFENGVFILKMHQLRSRNLKTQQSPVILDLCLRKTREITWLSRKSSVLKMFSVHTKTQSRRFLIPPFSRRISVDGTCNRRNKAAFSNFSGWKFRFVHTFWREIVLSGAFIGRNCGEWLTTGLKFLARRTLDQTQSFFYITRLFS